MKGYKVRFEQGRGHRMILEGEPPIEPGEIDPIQWRMLRSCDVPGLLKLESEELDGTLSLRYSLANRRMLSQTFRIARWTMEDALNALCRLAEVLEQSKDYMLDLDRYILEDDFIFAGRGPHDLAFVYLPLWRRTASASLSSDIERLIVRWMMNVEAPDGAIMQQLLRLASSPDFSPALLRRYIRQTLAGAAGSAGSGSLAERPGETQVRKPNPAGIRSASPRERDRPSDSPPPIGFDSAKRRAGRSVPEPESQHSLTEPGGERSNAGGSTERERGAVASMSWPPADPQGLSGLLGEASSGWPQSSGPVNDEEPVEGTGRRRIWMLGLTAVLVAFIWRFVYLPRPSGRGMLIASGLTVILAAVCCWLLTRQRSAGSVRSGEREQPERLEEVGFEPIDEREHDELEEPVKRGGTSLSSRPESLSPRFGMGGERVYARENRSLNDEEAARPPGARGSAKDSAADAEQSAAIEPLTESREALTAWLPSHEEGTALLGANQGGTLARRQQPYLEWDREGVRERIKLTSDGIVIGRSREAAQHIDDTEGISRAHLELALGDDAWQARDLGSRNGSWLNGVPMAPYEAYPLSKGDSIQIASSLYRFKDED